MTTAQEMRGLLKPMPEQPLQVNLHRTDEAFVKLLEMMEQSALKNCGGIQIHLSDYLDHYSRVEEGFEYSTQEIIRRLQLEEYKVLENIEYHTIIWDKEYPVDCAVKGCYSLKL
jgi:hypothetical protein